MAFDALACIRHSFKLARQADLLFFQGFINRAARSGKTRNKQIRKCLLRLVVHEGRIATSIKVFSGVEWHPIALAINGIVLLFCIVFEPDTGRIIGFCQRIIKCTVWSWKTRNTPVRKCLLPLVCEGRTEITMRICSSREWHPIALTTESIALLFCLILEPDVTGKLMEPGEEELAKQVALELIQLMFALFSPLGNELPRTVCLGQLEKHALGAGFTLPQGVHFDPTGDASADGKVMKRFWSSRKADRSCNTSIPYQTVVAGSSRRSASHLYARRRPLRGMGAGGTGTGLGMVQQSQLAIATEIVAIEPAE